MHPLFTRNSNSFCMPACSLISSSSCIKNQKTPTATNRDYSFLLWFTFSFPLPWQSPVASESSNYEPKILMGLFILIWAADSWAFVSGSLFGKHKLFERLSPKKKPGKAFGGSVVLTAGTRLSIIHHRIWVVIIRRNRPEAILTVFVGTAGDLFQSMLKRASGLKDLGYPTAGAWRNFRPI